MAGLNLWHDLNFGEDASETVRAVIEIPKNSRTKYEIDKETGLLSLDRILFSSVMYPENYGFIPQTYCEDGDALDIIVLCSAQLAPLTLVDTKIIGVMKMIDGGETDDKLIAVAKGDPTLREIKDLSDLSELKIGELRTFFEDYKKLEKKHVEITGFFNREEAIKVLNDSIELYKKTF
jgi:inorganic pyrophosphatase